MIISKIFTRSILGLDSPQITVEVSASSGLPRIKIVGTNDRRVVENIDKVTEIIKSLGFKAAPKKIIVNLAPAEIIKQGARFDLSVTLAYLFATEQLQTDYNLTRFEFYGELGLDGILRKISGIVPSLLNAQQQAYHEKKRKTIIIPFANIEEAKLVSQTKYAGYCDIYLANNLIEVCNFLLKKKNCNTGLPNKLKVLQIDDFLPNYEIDYSEIKGQIQAISGLKIAASGGHSVIMVGPPGAGKSMLAKRFVTILPILTQKQAIEKAIIFSVANEKISQKNFYQKELINPHYNTSSTAIIGGGTIPKPGSISLAHNSVLFLDELPEFKRDVLAALRTPLQDKKISIVRANYCVDFPANFQLICAMNPSPSGYFLNDHLGRCKDSPERVRQYIRNIVGPLSDRIDLQIKIPEVSINEIKLGKKSQFSSKKIAEQVKACQELQIKRQNKLNADLNNNEIADVCEIEIDQKAQNIMEHAIKKFGLSTRSYHKILIISRTIADLQNRKINSLDIAQAISYRNTFDTIF